MIAQPAADMLKRTAQVGAVTIALELAVAVLWPAPPQDQFDPSGRYGSGGGRPLRVAALGDSTLTAPGVGDGSEVWVAEVCRRLSAATNRPVELHSFGVGGATAAQVAATQLTAAISVQPDLALVSVGANDVIRGVRWSRLVSDLDRIVAALVASGSVVITSGVGDLGAIPRLAPPLRQMATALGRRADRAHDVVTERHGAIKARQWAWATNEFRTRSDIWSPDRFHPNREGHLIWAQVCWEALEPLLPGLEELPG